jgi:hypothetical protein
MSNDLRDLERLVVRIVAQFDQQLALLKDLQSRLDADELSEDELTSMLQKVKETEHDLREQASRATVPYRRLKAAGRTTFALDQQFRALADRFRLDA